MIQLPDILLGQIYVLQRRLLENLPREASNRVEMNQSVSKDNVISDSYEKKTFYKDKLLDAYKRFNINVFAADEL